MIIKEELTDHTLTECPFSHCSNISIDLVLTDWKYISNIDAWVCPECVAYYTKKDDAVYDEYN